MRLDSAGSGKPLIVVHGLQGDAVTFKPLASRLQAQVYVLQLAKGTHIQSVRKIAQQYIQVDSGLILCYCKHFPVCSR